jgi:biopolymer transport protein TolQ
MINSAVNIAILSSTGMLPLSNVMFAFGQSHISGKLICLVLLASSIFAWSIMITKLWELRRAMSESRRFLAAYRKEAHPVAVFLKRQKYANSPVWPIYERTCKALGSVLEPQGADEGELFMGGVGSIDQHLTTLQMNAVSNVAQRTMTDMALILEDNMGFLATSVTAAPFLGLLGTVWGVMVAFGAMSQSGSAMLSEVAPGIAGALLTTVVGLLVALPSSIGYNMIASQIRRLRVRMDNFVQEFTSDMERHFINE